ncbi:coiled-coil domain-containing 22 family protein [Cognatitamlana onchidii]|uniref:hypothetical protein n=1 Tax=Cognatitamlana onchidii TaxID=2562860 RepID=UPI0010A649B4|nr:hypothetical protein [Algibacter onchidii]
MKNKKTFRLLVLSLLVLLAIAPLHTMHSLVRSPECAINQPHQTNPKKQNAISLIESASKALTYTIKASKESKDKRIDIDNKSAAPYWKTLKKLNNELNKTERGALLKDETFFTGMAAALSTSEELKIVFQMTNVSDANIKKGIEKTTDAIHLLYTNYSKEAQDKDSNKPLNAQERKQLETLKSKQKELQAKLDDMETKMGKNAKGVKELRKKSKELENAQNNRNDYFWAMHTFNMMHGWMWGWHWYWGPWGGWCPGFSVVIIDSYWDYYAFYDGYDWGYMDPIIDMDYALDYEIDLIEMDVYSDYIDNYEYIQPDTYDDYNTPDTYDHGHYDLQDHGSYELDSYDGYGGFDNYDQGGGGLDVYGW